MRILFVNAFKTPNPFMWITAIWTRGKYSHCEFLFDDDKMFGASFTHARCIYSDYEPEDKYEIIEIDLTLEEQAKIRLDCDDVEGKRYDYVGLFGFVFKSNAFDHKSKLFCSELISELLNKHTSFQSSKKPHRTSPVRLYKDILKQFKQ